VWGQEDLAYAIERFDRTPERRLIHIEDFAQVRGFYPESKYKGTFETLAALIYRGRDESSLREFARRLTFNTLIGNGDAHLKNWSLIYRDPRRPVLSPAYDFVATFVYQPQDHTEDLGLAFNGSKSFEAVGPTAFARLERKLKVDAGLAEVSSECARRTLEAVESEEMQLAHHSKDLAARVVDRVRTTVRRFLG
jgi:serine/threonine-protein kinase HipA